MKDTAPPIQPTRSTLRKLLAAAIIILGVALLAAALTIPFRFESQTMFYKFGWDKTLLRAGKMVGLAAAFLLSLQLALAGRLKWLDRIYSLPALYTAHRYIAYTIVLLVVLHPVLIFIPDKLLMIPFETRYWPEWVGAGLLVVILLQFGVSRWRTKFFRKYQKWLWVHRILGISAMTLLVVHVLYVSETFEIDGLPRYAVMVTAAILILLWVWVRLKETLIRRKDYRISMVAPAGENAHTIELKSDSGRPFVYLPGQFAFLSFDSIPISKEPHPFTIASSPLRPDTIQFTIRGSGDWTRQTGNLKVGDRAYLQGPFGHFSNLMIPSHTRSIIMIAGGIGITPMLSMLRHMVDTSDQRSTTLIWSNQTRNHLFAEHELDRMAEHLTDFTWIPTFTREKSEERQFGRLNLKTLEKLLESHDRQACIFLCGPAAMIRQVSHDLTLLGFQKRSIHFEMFGL